MNNRKLEYKLLVIDDGGSSEITAENRLLQAIVLVKNYGRIQVLKNLALLIKNLKLP